MASVQDGITDGAGELAACLLVRPAAQSAVFPVGLWQGFHPCSLCSCCCVWVAARLYLKSDIGFEILNVCGCAQHLAPPVCMSASDASGGLVRLLAL